MVSLTTKELGVKIMLETGGSELVSSALKALLSPLPSTFLMEFWELSRQILLKTKTMQNLLLLQPDYCSWIPCCKTVQQAVSLRSLCQCPLLLLDANVCDAWCLIF